MLLSNSAYCDELYNFAGDPIYDAWSRSEAFICCRFIFRSCEINSTCIARVFVVSFRELSRISLLLLSLSICLYVAGFPFVDQKNSIDRKKRYAEEWEY